MDATRASKWLFGRSSRLPVAVWVLQHGKRFYQSEPPTFGTTSASNIRQELERLVQAGMLTREQPEPGRNVWYEKTDSPLWEIVDTAARVTGLRWSDGQLLA